MAIYDQVQGRAAFDRPIPNPPPARAIIIIGADWCPDTQATMANLNYASQTSDQPPIPIYYINDANAVVHLELKAIPGAQKLLPGVESSVPPSPPQRGYNYPTIVEMNNGELTRVLYADRLPEGIRTMNDLVALSQAQVALATPGVPGGSDLVPYQPAPLNATIERA